MLKGLSLFIGIIYISIFPSLCFGNDVIIAIYDDTASEGASAWPDGLDYIEQALQESEITVIRITRNELNTEPTILNNANAFIFGGGYAYPGYTFHITDRGKDNIRKYVANGGIFIGICAGAYFACSQIKYENQYYDDESGYNLDLYPGTGFGPLEEIASYPEWDLSIVKIEEIESLQSYIQQNTYSIWYGGGPYFTDLPADTVPIATFTNIANNHKGCKAIICYNYKDGKVILWGPHPEVIGEPASNSNRNLFTGILLWAIGLTLF